jgi:hypothetical protein
MPFTLASSALDLLTKLRLASSSSLQHFAKEPKNPLGRIVLNSYFVSKMDDSSSFEFCVNAYPKVRTWLIFVSGS